MDRSSVWLFISIIILLIAGLFSYFFSLISLSARIIKMRKQAQKSGLNYQIFLPRILGLYWYAPFSRDTRKTFQISGNLNGKDIIVYDVLGSTSRQDKIYIISEGKEYSRNISDSGWSKISETLVEFAATVIGRLP